MKFAETIRERFPAVDSRVQILACLPFRGLPGSFDPVTVVGCCSTISVDGIYQRVGTGIGRVGLLQALKFLGLGVTESSTEIGNG